jgi:hypothetical protein
MARANEGAVRQYDRRRGARDLELRDGNPDFRMLYHQFHVPQAQSLPGSEFRLRDASIVYVRSIGGSAVPHYHSVFAEDEIAVPGRNRGMIQREVVLGAPTEAVESEVQVDNPVLEARASDY